MILDTRLQPTNPAHRLTTAINEGISSKVPSQQKLLNPIVVVEVASVVPTAQIPQPRFVLLNRATAARSSESHVGIGPERVPPRWQQIPPAYVKCSPAASESHPWSRTGLLRDLYETVLGDWRPANVPACVAQEVFRNRSVRTLSLERR